MSIIRAEIMKIVDERKTQKITKKQTKTEKSKEEQKL